MWHPQIFSCLTFVLYSGYSKNLICTLNQVVKISIFGGTLPTWHSKILSVFFLLVTFPKNSVCLARDDLIF